MSNKLGEYLKLKREDAKIKQVDAAKAMAHHKDKMIKKYENKKGETK